MSRFLARKKGKEKYELQEGVAATQGVPTGAPGPNYGSITSLLNNEVRRSTSCRRGLRPPREPPQVLLPPTMVA